MFCTGKAAQIVGGIEVPIRYEVPIRSWSTIDGPIQDVPPFKKKKQVSPANDPSHQLLYEAFAFVMGLLPYVQVNSAGARN